MAYQLKKVPDGDVSLGNLRGEVVDLIPSTSDYATGGYLVQGIGGTTESTGNVGIDKVLFVVPIGGQGGYVPVFNPTTSKVQMFQQGASAGALTQVAAAVDLSASTFRLLVVGL
jgi:hypothetical protein